jgi:hypothetical protein
MITNAAKRGILLLMVVGLAGFAVRAADQSEVPFVQGEGPPAAAKPGEAWCLCRRPATYKTVCEQVQVAPATSYVEFIPAKWETKEETVCVQPESKRAVVVPAKYKTETFQQCVKPEHTELEVVCAQYECVDEVVNVKPECEDIVIKQDCAPSKCTTETVQVAPAYAFWKETGGSGCDIKCYCRCEVPAKFVTIKKWAPSEPIIEKVKRPGCTKTIKVTKLVKDAEVRKKVIPAEVVTLTREVCEAPAEVKYEVVPAKFETIQKQVQVAPETSKKVEVPAKFETVNKQVLDQPEHMVWVKKTCDCKSSDCKDVVKKYHEIPGTDEKSLRMLLNK